MAEQNREILKVEHLKKYFPVPNGMLHAVDDISFTIEPVSYTHLTLPTN